MINLNVSVTDPRNRYVTDLLEKDFAVFEDGVKQELMLFSHENLPISLVLMVDCSASMDEKLRVAQDAAVGFVKTLTAQDRAEVVQFNDRRTVLQDFTPDHRLLEEAIRHTEASGPTALHNALYVSLKELDKEKSGRELRRRAIVLLSDGEDTASLVSDDQVTELARKTEIAIYSISLRPGHSQDRNRLAFSQAEHLLTTLSQETGATAACGGENGSPATLTFARIVSATARSLLAGMLTTPASFTNGRFRPPTDRQSEKRVITSR